MKQTLKHIFSSMLLLVLVGLISGCSKAGKVDAALDDLERICDRTVAISEKIKKGDQSALADMSKLTADYQSYTEKLETLKEGDGFTPAQQQRYMRILEKYQAGIR